MGNCNKSRGSIKFGVLAQRWRERCGFSRVDLARKIGEDYLSVYKFETGRTNSLWMLSKYIRAGFDPVYEMTRKEDEK